VIEETTVVVDEKKTEKVEDSPIKSTSVSNFLSNKDDSN
jgi:hypothetical protein